MTASFEDRLFRVGSVWQHNNTGLLVRLDKHREGGGVKLVWARPEDNLDGLARYLLQGPWDVEDLLREFTLVDSNVPYTRYEALLDNADEDDESV